jgi:hypothetical protein
VHASDGTKSGENDLVIYDKTFTPFIYQDEATHIFPIECVYGIIEVKSTVSWMILKSLWIKYNK